MAAGRSWEEIDIDEQEYLDRMAQFSEGYVDLASLMIPEIVVDKVVNG